MGQRRGLAGLPDGSVLPRHLNDRVLGMFYTDEKMQNRLVDFLAEGEGIDLEYDVDLGQLIISGEDASAENKGIARFAENDFGVANGLVSIKDEKIDDRVANLLVEGEGIDLSYDDDLNLLLIAAEDASNENKGIAKFLGDDFDVNEGLVSLKEIDHGGLAGLGDDDHQQYLLVDGSREMSGALTIGGTQPTLTTPAGKYLSLGGQVTSHGLNAPGDLVAKRIETNQAIYCDGNAYYFGTMSIFSTYGLEFDYGGQNYRGLIKHYPYSGTSREFQFYPDISDIYTKFRFWKNSITTFFVIEKPSTGSVGDTYLDVWRTDDFFIRTYVPRGSGDIVLVPNATEILRLQGPTGQILMADGKNIALNTTTGTKIGTATNQKLAFFGATPVIQQPYTGVSDPPTQAEVTAIRDCLVNLGLMASS